MMTNGIPGIENIGGDIDEITGKRCTFFAFPWRWPDGEGCALRVVAVLDPHRPSASRQDNDFRHP